MEYKIKGKNTNTKQRELDIIEEEKIPQNPRGENTTPTTSPMYCCPDDEHLERHEVATYKFPGLKKQLFERHTIAQIPYFKFNSESKIINIKEQMRTGDDKKLNSRAQIKPISMSTLDKIEARTPPQSKEHIINTTEGTVGKITVEELRFIKAKEKLVHYYDIICSIGKGMDFTAQPLPIIRIGYTYKISILGSFGKIKKVRHKVTKEERALKILKKYELSLVYRNIMQEFNMLKGLDHPNILRLFEVYQDDFKIYIVTELCEGIDMADYLTYKQDLSERFACTAIYQILKAVHYCHFRGIVHRDLKPENFMFTNTEMKELKLIDFGCSEMKINDNSLLGLAGSIPYMAPEIIRMEKYNEKCDIWSIGVNTYLLLSGNFPFKGATRDQEIKSILGLDYQFDPGSWWKISQMAKSFIKECLNNDPQKRPSTNELLHHPWIQFHCKNQETCPSSLIRSAFQRMRDFKKQKIIKRGVLAYLASNIQRPDEKIFQSVFNTIDTTKDGRLGKTDLITSFIQNNCSLTEWENKNVALVILDIMINVNISKSGYIEYNEFLMSQLDHRKLLTECNLKSAFDTFSNDQGKINVNELKTIFDPKYTPLPTSKTNTTLSFAEFKKMMLSVDIDLELVNEQIISPVAPVSVKPQMSFSDALEIKATDKLPLLLDNN